MRCCCPFTLRLLTSLLLIAAVVGGVCICWRVGNPFDPFDNRTFSANDWQAAAPVKRCGMARDLVRRHLRRGMTAGEVVALLGKPDFIDDGETDKAPDAGPRTYEYGLKHVDSPTLYWDYIESSVDIDLDANNRVIKVRLQPDSY